MRLDIDDMMQWGGIRAFARLAGGEKYALVSAVVTDGVERGNAVVIAGDSFAIDDAGARAQAGQRLGD